MKRINKKFIMALALVLSVFGVGESVNAQIGSNISQYKTINYDEVVDPEGGENGNNENGGEENGNNENGGEENGGEVEVVDPEEEVQPEKPNPVEPEKPVIKPNTSNNNNNNKGYSQTLVKTGDNTRVLLLSASILSILTIASIPMIKSIRNRKN